MPLRMSTLFLRTLREDPADAEVPSHRLLVRGGYIRRVSPGIYTWLPLGLRVLRKVEQIVREEMDAARRAGGALPRAAAPRALRGDGPLGGVRRRHLPAQGPQGQRLPARADPRGDVHPRWSRTSTRRTRTCPLSLYQIQTKYRDEARPRAGILRGREFVMKDSYSFDISDEAFPASYELHRNAYIKIFDRLGLDYVIVAGDVGRHGRVGQRGVPGHGGGRRGHLRALHELRLRGQRRGRAGAGAAGRRRDRGACRARRGHAGHPDHRDAGRPPERDVPPGRPAVGGRRHAQERHRHGAPPGRSPRAAGDRRARRPRGRPEAARGAARAGRGRAVHRGGLREEPRAGQGLHRPRRPRGAAPAASGSSSTPASSTAPAGSPAPTDRAGTSSTWSPAATSRPTARSRRPRSATATRARWTARRSSRRAASRWATSSSSAASTPRRSGLKVLDENGKLVTVTMGSYGVGVSRAVAAIAESTHDDIGLCWPRRVAPADVHLVATGKDEEIFQAAEGSGRTWRRKASGCSTTTAAASGPA